MALDIEFLLISIIQGVALSALATASIKPLTNLEFVVWPYIITAFLFIIIFWSGAIMHTVSFIDWPIDLVHSVLYFLVSLNEILAILNLEEPRFWFVFMLGFTIFAFILYIYDLQIIKRSKKKFSLTDKTKELYKHITTEQKRDLKTILPFSFVFYVIAVTSLFLFPELFLEKGYNLIFIFIQMVISVIFLRQVLSSFKERAALINGI